MIARLRSLFAGERQISEWQPPALYYANSDGSLTPVRERSTLAAWQARATRSSFTQNLINALTVDYTSVDADLLSRAYIMSVTAAACVEVNAQFMASVPLVVHDRAGTPLKSDDPSEALHPLGNVVSRSADLLAKISVSQDIWGRAYLVKRRNRHGFPSTLEWIRTPDVEQNVRYDPRTRTEELQGYTIHGQEYNKWDVIDLPLMDPNDPLGALSPLEFVITQVSIGRNMAVFAANFFFNGARLSGILQLPGIGAAPADPQAELAKVAKEFNALYAGARKAHKTFVTADAGAKFTPTSAPPEDLEMPGLHQVIQGDIARAFHVNPVLVGLGDAGDPLSSKGTYRAIEANQLLAHTLPRLRQILTQLNEQWAWLDFEPQDYYSLVADLENMDALSPVTAENIQASSQMRADGGITLNEYRARLGMPDWGDNGEVVTINGVLYPVEALAEVARANLDALQAGPPAFPFMSGGQPVNITNNAPPLQLPAHSNGAALKELALWERKVSEGTPDTPFYFDALEPYEAAHWLRRALEKRQDVETAFGIARSWLESGERPPGVRAALAEATPEEAYEYWARYDELRVDLGEAWLAWMERIAEDNAARILAAPETFDDLLTPDEQLRHDWLGTPETPGPLAQLMLAGMAAGIEAIEKHKSTAPPGGAQRQGIVSFDLLSQEAWDFVNSYYFDLIKGINNTTAEQLQKIIAQWIEDGEDKDELARRLTPIFRDRERARVIAQTESSRAYSEGTFNRYEAAGVTEARWQTVNVGLGRVKKLPGDVCHICGPLHHAIGNIKEGWEHPGGPGQAAKYQGKRYWPGQSHPRCRCFSTPEF